MFVSWTFGRKLGAGFGMAGVILLLVAIAGYTSTETLIENERKVNHTHEVRRLIARLTAIAVEAETAARLYLISGNPAHMEPVTHKENMHRNPYIAAKIAKTHCPYGHPYSPENTRIGWKGQRNCRTCERIRTAKNKAKKAMA